MKPLKRSNNMFSQWPPTLRHCRKNSRIRFPETSQLYTYASQTYCVQFFVYFDILIKHVNNFRGDSLVLSTQYYV